MGQAELVVVLVAGFVVAQVAADEYTSSVVAAADIQVADTLLEPL